MPRRMKYILRIQPMCSRSTGERVIKVEGSFSWPGHGRMCRVVLISKGGRRYFKFQAENEQRLGEKKRQPGLLELLKARGSGTSPGPWQ